MLFKKLLIKRHFNTQEFLNLTCLQYFFSKKQIVIGEEINIVGRKCKIWQDKIAKLFAFEITETSISMSIYIMISKFCYNL